MPAQPNEPASESLRNALQILNAEEPYESRGQRWVEYAAEDVEAIRARLEAALAKLDAETMIKELAFAKRAYMDGIVRDGFSRGEHRAHVDYPDLEERRGAASEPPLDYERPGQVDPVLRGQEISEDAESPVPQSRSRAIRTHHRSHPHRTKGGNVSKISKCPRCGGNIIEPAYEGDGDYPIAPMCECEVPRGIA